MNKYTKFIMNRKILALIGIVLTIFLAISAYQGVFYQKQIETQSLTPQSPGVYVSIDPQKPHRTVIVLDTSDERQQQLAKEITMVMQKLQINPALQSTTKEGSR